MAATTDLLDFLAPAVVGASDDDKARALALAEVYRPACLPTAKQDEAQAWYAAWLLYDRIQQTAEVAPGISTTGVTSMKEGDVQITWGAASKSDSGEADPLGFYGRWAALNKLCGYGAITVGIPSPGCCCG